MMEEIEGSKKDLFTKTLQVVDKNFQTIFKQLSSKGDAYLEVENPEKPFEEGLKIKVKLTGDKFLDIRSLSGGEKTAVALAYRLALNQVINNISNSINTKDLIILDEPTDGFSEEQLDKIRDIIKELKMRQIIIVSHENKVESFVDNVIKIKKDNHISKVIR